MGAVSRSSALLSALSPAQVATFQLCVTSARGLFPVLTLFSKGPLSNAAATPQAKPDALQQSARCLLDAVQEMRRIVQAACSAGADPGDNDALIVDTEVLLLALNTQHARTLTCHAWGYARRLLQCLPPPSSRSSLHVHLEVLAYQARMCCPLPWPALLLQGNHLHHCSFPPLAGVRHMLVCRSGLGVGRVCEAVCLGSAHCGLCCTVCRQLDRVGLCMGCGAIFVRHSRRACTVRT